MQAAAVEARLLAAPPGSQLFVSYLAARSPPPADRAVLEAGKARDEGYSRRWLQGRLEGVYRNRRGELYATLFTHTRYNLDDPAADGHFRSFNPRVGTVLTLEVLS